MSERDEEVEAVVKQIVELSDDLEGRYQRCSDDYNRLCGDFHARGLRIEELLNYKSELEDRWSAAEKRIEELEKAVATAGTAALDNASSFAALGALTATTPEAIRAGFPQEIADAKADGAREENEACAQMAENFSPGGHVPYDGKVYRRDVAAAIRARRTP